MSAGGGEAGKERERIPWRSDSGVPLVLLIGAFSALTLLAIFGPGQTPFLWLGPVVTGALIVDKVLRRRSPNCLEILDGGFYLYHNGPFFYFDDCGPFRVDGPTSFSFEHAVDGRLEDPADEGEPIRTERVTVAESKGGMFTVPVAEVADRLNYYAQRRYRLADQNRFPQNR